MEVKNVEKMEVENVNEMKIENVVVLQVPIKEVAVSKDMSPRERNREALNNALHKAAQKARELTESGDRAFIRYNLNERCYEVVKGTKLLVPNRR